ncbi:MAG: hypothetical protein JXK08_03950 [Flavobacteriaceae bacterium]|nr:hypothetical protein [Flavobacteriaceae bacterium]HIC32582.1 hypothetical protein [Flavobacteriaceae bacterium]
MFSKGQIIFGVLFAIAFIIVMVFMYRKDLKLHKIHYRGVLWILLAFLAFIGLIASIKFIFM